MALTFTKDKEGVVGDLRYWSGSITFDSSYPTGGEAITASNFGFGSTIYALQMNPNVGLLPEFDRTNLKIKVYYPTGGSASAPTTLAAPLGTIASGASAINSPGLSATVAITPGQAKEVGNTADLSTFITQVFAMGQ